MNLTHSNRQQLGIASFKYEFGGEGGIRTHDRVAPITVFELARAVRQYPNGASSYCRNPSWVMPRAGGCRIISARSARAVHTSNAARDRLRGASVGPVKDEYPPQPQGLY